MLLFLPHGVRRQAALPGRRMEQDPSRGHTGRQGQLRSHYALTTGGRPRRIWRTVACYRQRCARGFFEACRRQPRRSRWRCRDDDPVRCARDWPNSRSSFRRSLSVGPVSCCGGIRQGRGTGDRHRHQEAGLWRRLPGVPVGGDGGDRQGGDAALRLRRSGLLYVLGSRCPPDRRRSEKGPNPGSRRRGAHASSERSGRLRGHRGALPVGRVPGHGHICPGWTDEAPAAAGQHPGPSAAGGCGEGGLRHHRSPSNQGEEAARPHHREPGCRLFQRRARPLRHHCEGTRVMGRPDGQVRRRRPQELRRRHPRGEQG